MPRIPVGDFGNLVAPAAPAARIPPTGRGAAARGLDTLGRGMQIAGQTGLDVLTREQLEANRRAEIAANKAEAERKQMQERADRGTAGAALLKYQNQAYDLTEGITSRLQRGQISQSDAADEWRRSSVDLKEQSLEIVPEWLKPDASNHMGAYELQHRAVVGKAIEQRTRQDVGANLVVIENQAEQLASRDLPAAEDQFERAMRGTGPEAGLTPAQIEERIGKFRERATHTFYASRLDAASHVGPGAVQGVLKVLESDGTGLDPDRRRVLIEQARGQLDRFQHQAEVMGEKRERQAQQLWQGYVELTDAGKTVSPEFVSDMSKRLQGTPYAKLLAESVKDGARASAFAAMPITKQDQQLQLMLEKGNGEKGWTPAEQKRYKQLETMNSKTLEDIKADALRAGLERGVVQSIAPLDLSSMPALFSTLKTRHDTADAVAVWAGREVSPLRPDEAKLLSTMLNTFQPAQRATALGEIAKTMSPERMRALATQLGDKGSALTTAAMYEAGGVKTTLGRSVAGLVLEGDAALKEGRAKIDQAKETGVRATIYSQLHGAYATTDAEKDAADSAYRIYAAHKAEGIDDVDQAVRIATGGIYEGKGYKVPKPYGWSNSDFERNLRAVTSQDLARFAGADTVRVGDQALSVAELQKHLPDARLISAGDATYAVQVGARVVQRLDGRPLLMKLEMRSVR